MSNTDEQPVSRDDAFAKCRDRTSAKAKEYKLENVKYHEKMTKDEVHGLAQFLKDHGIKTLDALLAYSTLELANSILCRFPRPSELARAAFAMGLMDKNGRSYWRACLHLSHVNPNPKIKPGVDAGKFVGNQGANFASLTKAHDLIYMWLHGYGNYELKLYGRTKHDVEAAAEKIAAKARAYHLEETDDPTYTELKFNSRARDFVTDTNANAGKKSYKNALVKADTKQSKAKLNASKAEKKKRFNANASKAMLKQDWEKALANAENAEKKNQVNLNDARPKKQWKPPQFNWADNANASDEDPNASTNNAAQEARSFIKAYGFRNTVAQNANTRRKNA